jgi:hypothetical protein
MGIQVLSLYFEWCHKLRNGEQRPPHIKHIVSLLLASDRNQLV